MERVSQRHRMEKRSLRTDDLKPPRAPVLDCVADLQSQFVDGFQSLNFSLFEVRYLYSDFIQDLFLIAE